MVLIPNGGGGYCGIGLVKAVWKVVKVILNRHFTVSVAFHGVLHGFWSDCGTCATFLGAVLLQKLTAMREEVLYIIFQ